jgi:hypothetical protein
MDNLEEITGMNSKRSFIKHVFSFDDDDKGELMNIVQYAMLALIPVIILNKTMQKYVPEADEEKGSVEISAEVIFQIIYMFLGVYLINKMITYVPTYGGLKYPDFSVVNIILTSLVIVLSLQTKLGEKVSILVGRLTDLWDGTTGDGKKKKGGKNGTVKVSQPISQNQNQNQAQMQMQMTMPQMAMSTPISQLPEYTSSSEGSHQQSTGGGFDVSQGGMMDSMGGVLPASEFLGGGSSFANF